MQMWCKSHNQKTIFRQIVGGIFAAVLLLTSLWLQPTPVHAEAAAYTIGFQGRLLLKGGTPVKDGNYNMQFTLYEGGDGLKPGNPGGSVLWSESYLNTGKQTGVPIKDGRFAVQLGSIQPFANSIDWSKGNLRLSMNVAGSGDCAEFGSKICKADGEMLPMKQISASPYAMSAGKLGDKSADNFVQLGQGKQTDTSDNSSIFVDKTGNGHLIQLQHNGDDTFTVTNNGDIQLGGHGDRSITLNSKDTSGGNLTIKASDSSDKAASGGDLVLKGGDAHGEDAIGGNIVLKGGSGSRNDINGLVIIGTPTFETTMNDSSCRPDGKLATADCQISDKSINTSAAIIVGFDSDGKTARLPEPAIKTAGRIVYIIGASESKEFSLAYNGTGGSLTVQPDTATSLLWNGTVWVPIGPQASATPATQPDPKTVNETIPATTIPTTDDVQAAPIDTVEGSMYYDDALGKIRCYQDGTWGDCTAAPDAFVTISPEYSGAVMNGTDIGTISSDLCSDVLNINDGSNKTQSAICGKDETYNYYRWTSLESKSQTRSIYLTYKLPANFKQFVPNTMSLTARTDSDKAGVAYHLYRSRKTENLVPCGESTAFSEPPNSWYDLKAKDKADPANCDFKAGDSVLIRIDLSANSDTSAFVSNIDFIYSSR